MEGTDTLRRASQKLLGKKNMMITAGGVKALGRRLADIADRIDREHAEELAAEKRGLTGEAREAAADWVDKHGGLDEAKARMKKYYDITHRVLEALGLQALPLDDQSERIMAELDKRLMPPGMEWQRFEDGEKVLFGDVAQDNSGDAATVEAVKFHDGQADVIFRIDRRAGTLLLSSGERVKRPDTEVLGADGLPIEEGDTVWDTLNGERRTVGVVNPEYIDCFGELFSPNLITHTPPDTQARIDDDATIHPYTYCNEVLGWDAHRIVRRGDLADQIEAMIADLLRRQRELDAKTTGGAK